MSEYLNENDLRIGDIVQIKRGMWRTDEPAIFVVKEVKSWGVKAEINILNGIIPVRLAYEDIILVGKVDLEILK